MTEAEFAAPPPAPSEAKVRRVVQRVVFPTDDLDVVPLYAETRMDRGAAELTADMLTSSLGKSKARLTSSATTANAVVGRGPGHDPVRGGRARPPGRGDPAPPQRGHRQRPPGLLRHLLQRVPGQLLAPVDQGRIGLAAHQAGRAGHDHDLPVGGQGPQPPGRDHPGAHRRAGDHRAHADADAVHRRRLVLVRHRGRAERHHADRGRVGGAGRRRPRRGRSAWRSPSWAHPTICSTSSARSARPPRCSTYSIRSTWPTRARRRSGTTRTSPTRPRSSATGSRSSSRATWAAPAASPAAWTRRSGLARASTS